MLCTAVITYNSQLKSIEMDSTIEASCQAGLLPRKGNNAIMVNGIIW